MPFSGFRTVLTTTECTFMIVMSLKGTIIIYFSGNFPYRTLGLGTEPDPEQNVFTENILLIIKTVTSSKNVGC